MASIHKEIVVAADPALVWDAIRDVGNVHTRVAPGFLLDTRLNGEVRQVSFANGLVADELIVDVDDGRRRLAYAVIGGRPTHHAASLEVRPEGDGRSRVIWQADFKPDALKPSIETMMDDGCAAMKARLERTAAEEAAATR